MMTFTISNDKVQIIQKIKYGEKYLIQGEAGTGKTLLGLLIGKEMLKDIKSTQKVLYLTFSKLAKWQIKNSISLLRLHDLLLKEDISRLEIHNFHSLWWDLLVRFSSFLGIENIPTILLENELKEFSKDCFESIPKNIIPKEFLTQSGTINKKKEENLLKIFYGEGLIFFEWSPSNFGKFGELFKDSDDFLSKVKDLIIDRNQKGFFSHTETIFWIKELLNHHKNVFNLLKYHFPIIIIDEFQDTDISQWSIIQQLNPASIIVFADKKQTIHQWRGADPYRTEKFCEDYKIPPQNIFTLDKENRFKTKNKKPPPKESIELSHTPLSNIQNLNTAKKTAKIHCKKIALNAIKEKKNLAILCRTNKQADEITTFLRDNDDQFPGLLCERLGAENSPFEIAREILLILSDSQKNTTDYISNDIYQSIFPEKEKCTNRSRKNYLSQRYKDSVDIHQLLDENFHLALNKLVENLYKYEDIKNWKCNHSVLNCLNFVSKQLKNSTIEWKNMNNNEKRNLIDSLILQYENIILSSPPRHSICIMTVHQSKSREFDWVIIPWYSSTAWNYKEGRPWNLSLEEDNNLFHTAQTRAKSKFYVIETSYHLPKTNTNPNQTQLNGFI